MIEIYNDLGPPVYDTPTTEAASSGEQVPWLIYSTNISTFSNAKFYISVSTGNLTPSERRILGHENMLFLGVRRNKRSDEECNRSSSEDKENDIEDEEGNDIEDD